MYTGIEAMWLGKRFFASIKRLIMAELKLNNNYKRIIRCLIIMSHI